MPEPPPVTGQLYGDDLLGPPHASLVMSSARSDRIVYRSNDLPNLLLTASGYE
jgi:hypothetical protein